MRVPKPPPLHPIEVLSPSIYEALVRCPARAAWASTPFDARAPMPAHPSAVLGTAFHAVMAAAHRGDLEEGADVVRTRARDVFDRTALRGFEQAHPLLRAKFRSAHHLPYFNLLRERAVVRASSIAQAGTTRPATGAAGGPARQLTETKLRSRDGRIAGRPDFLDAEAREIVDYKSGGATAAGSLSDAEERQLRLYAYLAHENDINVATLVVVRADGARDTAPVTRTEAAHEGQKARTHLHAFNELAVARRTFEDVATPSPTACRGCQCIPFCEPFWRSATPTWSEAGVHLEGRLVSVDTSTQQGVPLLSLAVEVGRGTVPLGNATVEQLPDPWIRAGGGLGPVAGATIRVVDARISSATQAIVVRADKATTAVWEAVEDAADAT